MNDDIEIVSADPALRRAGIILTCIMLAALTIAYVTVDDPVGLLYGYLFEDIDELRAIDEAKAREESGKILVVTVFLALLSVFPMLMYAVISGIRMLRAEQWPRADARLFQDTKVIRGKRLRLQAALRIGVGLFFLCAITYYAAEVVLWGYSR